MQQDEVTVSQSAKDEDDSVSLSPKEEAAKLLIERTVKEVVTELYSEIGMLLHTYSDPYALSITIESLLRGDNMKGERTGRRIFRSPHMAGYLMDALGINDLNEFTMMLEKALEAAIDEPIKLRVITVWTPDIYHLELVLG